MPTMVAESQWEGSLGLIHLSLRRDSSAAARALRCLWVGLKKTAHYWMAPLRPRALGVGVPWGVCCLGTLTFLCSWAWAQGQEWGTGDGEPLLEVPSSGAHPGNFLEQERPPQPVASSPHCPCGPSRGLIRGGPAWSSLCGGRANLISWSLGSLGWRVTQEGDRPRRPWGVGIRARLTQSRACATCSLSGHPPAPQPLRSAHLFLLLLWSNLVPPPDTCSRSHPHPLPDWVPVLLPEACPSCHCSLVVYVGVSSQFLRILVSAEVKCKPRKKEKTQK